MPIDTSATTRTVRRLMAGTGAYFFGAGSP